MHAHGGEVLQRQEPNRKCPVPSQLTIPLSLHPGVGKLLHLWEYLLPFPQKDELYLAVC